MTKTLIQAGPCRFETRVTAEKAAKRAIKLTVESQCPNITKMFDAESRTFEPYSSYTDPNRYWYRENPPTESTVGGLGGWRVDHAQLAKGYAKTIKGSMLSIAYTLSDARDGKSTMPKSGVPVTIYEKDSPKKEKIYSGSINDIKTYDVFGEDCSLVVYCAYSGRVREIIVYK